MTGRDRAMRWVVMLLPVSRLGRTASRDDPDPRLRELAAETGGGYFLLKDDGNLGSTFAAWRTNCIGSI